jgi:hypothetical protein
MWLALGGGESPPEMDRPPPTRPLAAMSLGVDGAWGDFTRQGDLLRFRLSGAPPGADVRLYYSDTPVQAGDAWCPAGMDGWCLDLAAGDEAHTGWFTLPVVADGDGELSWTTPVPLGVAADRDYRFQAVAGDGETLWRSNVHGTYLESDADAARALRWYPMDLESGEVIDVVARDDGVALFLHDRPVPHGAVGQGALAVSEARRGEEVLHYEHDGAGRVWIAAQVDEGRIGDFHFEVTPVF